VSVTFFLWTSQFSSNGQPNIERKLAKENSASVMRWLFRLLLKENLIMICRKGNRRTHIFLGMCYIEKCNPMPWMSPLFGLSVSQHLQLSVSPNNPIFDKCFPHFNPWLCQCSVLQWASKKKCSVWPTLRGTKYANQMWVWLDSLVVSGQFLSGQFSLASDANRKRNKKRLLPSLSNRQACRRGVALHWPLSKIITCGERTSKV